MEEDSTSNIAPFSLPEVEGLCLKDLVTEAQQISVIVATTAPQACCPLCGVPTPRVQSRYQRTIADLPWAGVAVRLLLQVRRFSCDNTACQRRIFCERLGPAITAYARRTRRLDQVLSRIGLALGGQTGARLLGALGMQASPDTLLRRIQGLALLEVPTPRVLGVDDWAWRKGQRYGTLLCDLERHRVVDLLPDRRTETFAAWLLSHPGVEVISRDRAGNYAEGGRLGAPQAIQIADRWHLLANLADALDPVLRRLGRSLHMKTSPKEKPVPTASEKQVPLRLTPAQQQRREANRERFEQIQALSEQGRSLQEIARITGLDRTLVGYFIQSQPWGKHRPQRGREAGEAHLAPYLPYLHKRWKEGCQNSLQLWRELCARGYQGSASKIKPYVAMLRQVPADLLPEVFSQPSPAAPPKENFSVRPLLEVILMRPEERTAQQRQDLARVSAFSAQVATVVILAQEFAAMLRDRHVQAFADWLDKAQHAPVRELRQFAHGLERDRAAVEAALSRPESNGQTEGHVNRLKLLKRQMYGRASFDLLRLRVIHAA